MEVSYLSGFNNIDFFNRISSDTLLSFPYDRNDVISFVKDLYVFLFEKKISSGLVPDKYFYQSFLNVTSFETSIAPKELFTLFLQKIENIYETLKVDAEQFYKLDPSMKSLDEVFLASSSFYSIALYRFSHIFYEFRMFTHARIISDYALRTTGVDIHGGAQIGQGFFIDHGVGVVIGETAQIGQWVSIYQGVTLGVHRFEKDEIGQIIRNTKRHPTIEDSVTIYTGAKILGGNTVIGHHSIIGAGSVVLNSVKPYSKIVQK